MRQADYVDPEFDARGECDRSLTACAREGAGGGADFAGYGGQSRNEAEGFKLFFSFLDGSCGENGRGVYHDSGYPA